MRKPRAPAEMAIAALERGDTEAAEEQATAILDRALQDRRHDDAARAAVIRSKTRLPRDHAGAISDADLAVRLSPTPGPVLAMALVTKATAAQAAGRWDMAREAITAAEAMIRADDRSGLTEMVIRPRVLLHLRDRRLDLAWNDVQYLVVQQQDGVFGLANYSLYVDVLAQRGDTAAAEAGMKDCERLATDTSQRVQFRASLVYYRTQWDQLSAAAIARNELLELIGHATTPVDEALPRRVMAELHLLEGDLGAALALVSAMPIDNDLTSAGWRHRVGAADALAQGDLDRVDVEVDECLRKSELAADDLAASTALNLQARAMLLRGDLDGARQALTRSAAIRSYLYAPLAARLDAEVEAAIADAAS